MLHNGDRSTGIEHVCDGVKRWTKRRAHELTFTCRNIIDELPPHEHWVGIQCPRTRGCALKCSKNRRADPILVAHYDLHFRHWRSSPSVPPTCCRRALPDRAKRREKY